MSIRSINRVNKGLVKSKEVDKRDVKKSSRRKLKLFANNFKRVRELFFDCLSRIWKDPYYPSATGPGESVNNG